MEDPELRATLGEILGVVKGLAGELERYRELLPEPGSVKARLLRRKMAATAVERWNDGS